MFLGSDHSDEPVHETAPIEANLRSIFDRLPRDRRLQVTIQGAPHFGFADDVKNHILMSVLRMRGNRLSGRRQLAIAAHYISGFFDVYLRGKPVSSLDPQPDNPELKMCALGRN
jgi:predicted dienelactone hydrolase